MKNLNDFLYDYLMDIKSVYTKLEFLRGVWKLAGWVGSFLMVYRNNSGRLGAGFISVCLETRWLGQNVVSMSRNATVVCKSLFTHHSSESCFFN